MDNKEVEKVLEELQEVRPEKLTGEAKRLFEAIMIIADSRDKAEADLYEANNRINDLLDIEKQKDAMINDLIEYISYVFNEDEAICGRTAHLINNQGYDCDENCKKCIKEFFEERCKNAKD